MLKHKILAILLSFSLSSIVLFVMVSNTFYTPLFHNPNLSISEIIPQGWGFFTKNPRDVVVQVYDYSTGESLIHPHSSPFYLFGLSRLPSRLIMEIGAVAPNIEDSLWVKDYQNTNEYKEGSFVSKKPLFKYPMLNDSIVITNQERTAWAWHKYKAKLSYPKNYVKIVRHD